MNRKIVCKNLCCIGMFVLISMVMAVCVRGQETAPYYDYIVRAGAGDMSDARSIQAELDKARSSEQMITVYIAPGEYHLDRWLRIYSNTHLILDEGATLYRGAEILDKNILRNMDAGNTADVGGYDMSHDIIIEGGTWDGGDINNANAAADLMRIDHAQNIEIKNCDFRNVYDCHLLELIAVKNATVSGCSFQGFRYQKGKEKNWVYAREAIQIETAWTNNENDLQDTASYWAGGTKVDGTACDNVTITDNRFIDMPCGVGQHHFTKSGKYRSTNITISNNQFVCSSSMKACKSAITCAGMNAVRIIGNKIQGPYRFGVHIEEVKDVTADKNKIANVTMNGIMVDSGEISSLSGNTIKNTKKHGISIGKGTISKINSNKISNVKENGICVTAGSVKNITGNKISKAGNNGISILPKAKVKKVTQNKTSGCKGHGVWNGSKKR